MDGHRVGKKLLAIVERWCHFTKLDIGGLSTVSNLCNKKVCLRVQSRDCAEIISIFLVSNYWTGTN